MERPAIAIERKYFDVRSTYLLTYVGMEPRPSPSNICARHSERIGSNQPFEPQVLTDYLGRKVAYKRVAIAAAYSGHIFRISNAW